MNDFEKLFKNIEQKLQGIDEKIKRKLDSIDAVVNEKQIGRAHV